jgi:hypothetical protein
MISERLRRDGHIWPLIRSPETPPCCGLPSVTGPVSYVPTLRKRYGRARLARPGFLVIVRTLDTRVPCCLMGQR